MLSSGRGVSLGSDGRTKTESYHMHCKSIPRRPTGSATSSDSHMIKATTESERSTNAAILLAERGVGCLNFIDLSFYYPLR
ncbi:hypothetical protein ACHAXM_002079 [Skeletonema potamos]